MTLLDDIDLDDLCRGDEGAWHAFVEAAGPCLRGVIMSRLHRFQRVDEAADVLQTVFLRLVRDDFRLLRQYNPKRASMRTWLGVIATTVTLDYLRKRTPRQDARDDPGAGVPAPAPQAEGDPLPVIPANLLPPRQALILKLLYADDRDVAEVASMLGIEAQTVRSLRHKAIERLRKLFHQTRPAEKIE